MVLTYLPHHLFPRLQGTGTLTCMSRALALEVAADERFRDWTTVARARNDYGTPCKSAAECAAQPASIHMWHHEDAGISYNVWRTVTKLIAASSGDGARVNVSESATNARPETGSGVGADGAGNRRKVHLIHLPEKGWFWPWYNSQNFAKPGMLAKAIVVHKVTPTLYPEVKAAWEVKVPFPKVVADCSQSCATWGWTRARVACDLLPPLEDNAGGWRGFLPRWNGTMCPLTPARHFKCCFLREANPGEDASAV
eukprot:scaffold312873_cov33-Tisochrysis_lutea.AAC.2